jgi:hypothetical protein
VDEPVDKSVDELVALALSEVLPDAVDEAVEVALEEPLDVPLDVAEDEDVDELVLELVDELVAELVAVALAVLNSAHTRSAVAFASVATDAPSGHVAEICVLHCAAVALCTIAVASAEKKPVPRHVEHTSSEVESPAAVWKVPAGQRVDQGVEQRVEVGSEY